MVVADDRVSGTDADRHEDISHNGSSGFGGSAERADRSAASVVQKIALAAIVDQADNSTQKPLLRGPTARSRVANLSDRFYTPTPIRPVTSGRDGSCLTKLATVIAAAPISSAAPCRISSRALF